MNTAPLPDLAINDDERRIVLEILDRLIPEYSVWAFGSRAQGRARPFSDLDLAIEGPRPLPPERMDELREAFRESPLPWKVDIVDLQSVADDFQCIIRKTGRLLHRPRP